MLGITTTGLSSSNYNNRLFYVEVKGLGGNDLVRTSHHTLTVPYNQLSKTMQRINRQGGHIVSVKPESALHLTEQLGDYLSGVPVDVLQQTASSDAGDAEASVVNEVIPRLELVETAEPEPAEAKVEAPVEVEPAEAKVEAPVEPETVEVEPAEAKVEAPVEPETAEVEPAEAKVEVPVEPEPVEAKVEVPAEVETAEAKVETSVEDTATSTKKSTKTKGIQPTKTTKKSTKTTSTKKTRKSKS